MATKNKRRKKQRASADLFPQAQRAFEKGNFKRALKDARVCYRQELSDERLLTSIIAFGDKITLGTETPISDVDRIKEIVTTGN